MRRKHREIVHVGRDGWLFLIGGTNGVLEQYRATLSRWWRLRGWVKLIEARAARARALGIRYVHVVVPEKLSVYDDRTQDLRFDPRQAPEPDLSAGEVAARCGMARVSARRYLEHLEQTGRAAVRPRYGVAGRPENGYAWLQR